MQYIKDAWASLTPRGRSILAIVIAVIVGLLLAYTMYIGYDWGWLLEALGNG